jgi:hypothetical protein
VEPSNQTLRCEQPATEDGAARQDVLIAIVSAVTGASRDQILEEFAEYPGRLREFRDEVLAGGPLWARLARGARRTPDSDRGD